MFAKLFQKTSPRPRPPQENQISSDVAPRVVVHYGIPSTASVLAFDPIQQLLAIGTLDGRIKVVGGGNIEGLLVSPKPIPFKNLEFLQNQGFLVSVSNENEIQVWDLESRCISSKLQWESNITAFSVIYGTQFMYLGDEYGFLSVLKFDAEEGKILQLPYHIPANLVAETAEISLPYNQSMVGVLPQPSSFGNRVILAYENGLLVLWDVSEDRAILVRGNKDLLLKDETVIESSNDGIHEPFDSLLDHEQAEKEISSLCWVSTDGSFLAVGYVDGDIFLWDLSVSEFGKGQATQKSPDKVVKIQLSSADRRLPVIVLHWSPNKAQNGFGGQLFVYGGEEIGSEEVLTIVDLDWSSGLAMLKCVHRIDLPLSGSFSDMIVIARPYEVEKNDNASLLVLTNPGQLHFYDSSCLSVLKSEPEKKHFALAVEYPATVPTIEPIMTVGKLFSVATNFSRVLAGTVSAEKVKVEQSMTKGTNRWPLAGGVPCQLSLAEDTGIERMYVAGYQDGTIRIWDATFPVLSLTLVLGLQVEGIEVAGASTSISALDFSPTSLSLAIGNEFGLVCLYGLDGTKDKTSFNLITQMQQQVFNSPHGSLCKAIFSLLNSPVRSLEWVNSGDRLAVGFECGQVAMLETRTLAVLFLTDTLSSSSAIISLAVKTLNDTEKNSPEQSKHGTSNESAKEVAFILTRDSHVVLVDGSSGKIISQPVHPMEESSAIFFYIFEDGAFLAEGSEDYFSVSSPEVEATSHPGQKNYVTQSNPVEDENSQPNLVHKTKDSMILLCCENALHLYSLKSVIQGENNSVYKLDLVKPCSWTAILTKDAKEYGLIIVYQTGEIEIRSLPKFTVLGSTSLASILRWNFKTNMEKLMSSSDKGQITLASGSEFAILSLLALENDFRIPETLPCLHDKVLAAAAHATTSIALDQKNKQSAVPGVFGGIIKGFKGAKKEMNNSEAQESVISHLEAIFSRFPFSDPLRNLDNEQSPIELNIDDIEIDEPVSVISSSSKDDNERKEKETERERLFEGSSTDTKPRLRTREEIIAKYRKTGDATSAAAQAKDKLIERQQKLEKLSERTAELQSGAESFAEMANELAKNMERRKWWNF
ncbi:hypothetical protein ACH5RR_016824 [Cinchona calisaya]|uniref:V-SNARE coiled-coil homology domain-containing protein n=1 Tax=Cinchona calisaya TaxID=153742 RepID=A0ABD3A077_9GENT